MPSNTAALNVGPHTLSWVLSLLEMHLLSREQGKDNIFKNTYKLTVELKPFPEWMWNLPGRVSINRTTRESKISLDFFCYLSRFLSYSDLCEMETNFQDSVTFNSMRYRLLKPAVKAETWASFSSPS